MRWSWVVCLWASVSMAQEASAPPPWSGSSVSTRVQAALPDTGVQKGKMTHELNAVQLVELAPEWRFTEAFALRGHLFIVWSAVSDQYSAKASPFSDLSLDAVWSGWTEARTGLHVEGSARLTLPTSTRSQAVARYFDGGGMVALSRAFPVLSGLDVSYAARVVGHAVQPVPRSLSDDSRPDQTRPELRVGRIRERRAHA